jgi:uncharacterized protein with PIN domain
LDLVEGTWVESFLVDEMLLRLGRWLRLVGLDVANPEGCGDRELLRRAAEDGRTLLTRDRRLAEACSKAGAECILVRASGLEDQLLEMAELGISLRLDPCRCTVCNSPLQEVSSAGRATWRCACCQKLYLEGSHWTKMEKMLEKIRAQRK